MDELIRPGEAAQMLGVSTDTIGRYMELGIIEGQRTPGGQRRIVRSSVEAVTRTRIAPNVTIIEKA